MKDTTLLLIGIILSQVSLWGGSYLVSITVGTWAGYPVLAMTILLGIVGVLIAAWAVATIINNN